MTADSKRTAQISPDRFGVGVATIVLVAIVMLSSMVFSYVAIAEASIWTHAPYGMHWLAPIFIDGAIITYTVALAVFEARREDRKTIIRTRAVLWGFAVFSVAINFAHAGSGWEWTVTSLEAWFGYLIAMSAPIAALLSAEAVVRLAFKHRRRVDEDAGERPARAAVADVDDFEEALAVEEILSPETASSAAEPDVPTEIVEVETTIDAPTVPEEPAIHTGPLYEGDELETVRQFERSHETYHHVPSLVEDQPERGEYVADPSAHREQAERAVPVF